ncbi:MAG: YjfB family protein [Lachnospiraceae bacterium]|nr:YjfB family protein [Lachnospiraceae bacterium]
MDIAALSMAMAQNRIMESFGVEMLSKTLDTQEQIGSEVVQMIDSAAMERSINPAIGGNIDISI